MRASTDAAGNGRSNLTLGGAWAAIAVVGALLLFAPLPARADFEGELARVDKALKTNPNRVSRMLLESCVTRRAAAIALFDMGQIARAERRLNHCKKLLGIPEAPEPTVQAVAAQAGARKESEAKARTRAAQEVEEALELTPNLENGLRVYEGCAACHMAEGWGLSNGSVPQLAGQRRTVIIKQLADIRAGNRDNPLMVPYSSPETIGGAQGIADVAGYIDTLEISVDTTKGSGDDLALGKKLYEKGCARCHGASGEGDDERFMPRIQAQHYPYLVRQFEWIRNGKRRNANAEMVAGIQAFSEEETSAVLDYVSRLEPPAELQAPPGWRNPDFEK